MNEWRHSPGPRHPYECGTTRVMTCQLTSNTTYPCSVPHWCPHPPPTNTHTFHKPPASRAWTWRMLPWPFACPWGAHHMLVSRTWTWRMLPWPSCVPVRCPPRAQAVAGPSGSTAPSHCPEQRPALPRPLLAPPPSGWAALGRNGCGLAARKTPHPRRGGEGRGGQNVAGPQGVAYRKIIH